ncbi:TolC family protein [Granulicella tundricola]|uniref:Outer membrane efflux protein n=1 Tax=Granulicella tundricola (strain ATCC BAA-1859 / DSM 23138 / MP5ACTX9) TaxID=1198114 RepID=E8X2U3_GRATM|nr:TolC family protein [Granulicella tundricola]ADW70390.1 outer membrane efflux protein [Granulicella tundricola MP5ACTX9]
MTHPSRQTNSFNTPNTLVCPTLIAASSRLGWASSEARPLLPKLAIAAAFAFTLSFSHAQQPQAQNPPALPTTPTPPSVPPISAFTPGVPTLLTGLPDTIPTRSAPAGLVSRRFFGPYRRPTVPPLFPGAGDRLRSLVHDGKLYLSAKDAIALAIESNLDVEVERYNLLLADTDKLRASGGGTLRGIDYTIAEPPNGVGGPGSPLLNTAAVNPNPTTPTVTDLTSLNSNTQATTNLSEASTATAVYAAGPSIPLFDPNLFLEAGYFRRSDTVTLTGGTTGTTGTTGTGATTGATTTTPGALNFVTANVSYIQGFHTGTQLELTVNNDSSVIYGSNSSYDPFSRPSTSGTVTQPLLRGFGRDVNTRFIKIANENKKIGRLLFEQQVLETVYGISRIYFDLVSLGENVAVQQEALRAAQKLRDDDANQVIEGTLAPIELTRVSALVSSSEFSLIQAQGLYRQQEVILRNQLLRADSPVFAAGFTEIVPTDTIVVPELLPETPVGDLIDRALERRPDLAQAQLQIKTGQINVAASRNQALPQLNAYVNAQTRGSTEQAYEQLGTPGTGIPTLPQNFALGGLRVSTIVQGGVQLNLPLRNRVAESDAARDGIQLRQVQARAEKLSNQIRQDIENATIAVDTAFAAYKASRASRGAQEQLLSAERDKLEFGQSTPLNVLQDEAYVAQAKSTEIAARSNYQKAQIELDRTLGDLLEKNGITLEDAVQGTVKQ